jgi:hypothetical protein
LTIAVNENAGTLQLFSEKLDRHGEGLFLVGIQKPGRERTSQARGTSPKTAMLGGPSEMGIKMELNGRAKPWKDSN